MADIKFDKPTEEVKEESVNLTESAELSEVKPAEAQTDASNSSDDTSDEAGEALETKEKATDGKKAVLTYIGGGVWRDEKGEVWARTDNTHANILSTRSYTMDEYEQRNDLAFMVKYGEMKLSLV